MRKPRRRVRMKINKYCFISCLLILLGLVTLKGKTPENPLVDLVNLVAAEEYVEEDYDDFADDLSEIISHYYAEYVIPDCDVTGFKVPVKGELTSYYGYRPKFKRFHKGIDVALGKGDTVKCALPGVVRKTGYEKKGYGRYVLVVHEGGLETLYGHLLMCMVNPGQKISAGDPLGLGGTTGNATGPHLHFETRYHGRPIDPLSWLNPNFFNK